MAAGGVTAAPSDKYRIVYADPPWDYGAHAQPDYQTEQRDYYPVMTVEAICAEPVKDWVEDDAFLFLWVTSPILEKAFHDFLHHLEAIDRSAVVGHFWL